MKKVVIGLAILVIAAPTLAATMCSDYGDESGGMYVCSDLATGENVVTLFNGDGVVELDIPTMGVQE